WVLLGVVLVMRGWGAASVYRVNRALLVERTRLPVQRGQPLADRVLLLAFMASFAALISFCALDVFRLHLAGKPPAAVSTAGLLLFAAGWGIAALALRDNAFAAVVVKHQPEHAVADGGVYAVVRHPMYAGQLPLLVGMGLWLESWAGALLACVPLAILVTRIHLEEAFLRRELEGYGAYAQRVRWRLIPGVW
ncbi:MAG TPA: isoprenylcysteine carboxylmethyltransferase family protein, partial [Longimicrobiaceae bacterium]|nr:isoprenylcysteine carboxylmethyltransferase family protein [Longimicrobiaceae bacterium]